MKNILIILVALLLWSCKTTCEGYLVEPTIPEGKGELKSSFVSENTTDDVLSITISQGDKVVEKWNDAKNVPEVIYLIPGDYTITAKTADEMPQVSDKPYYNASTDFTIVEGEVAYTSLECTMLNMKVGIELSEELLAQFPDWQADLFYVEDLNTSIATIASSENKPIYIAPAAFGVTLKDVATSESRTVIFEEYGAAMYHNVKFE